MIIDEIIFNYLEQEDTDYAILINGNWGSGKTYYWKNILSERIKARKFTGKTYKPVYISLYGLNSLREIDKLIFLASYNFSTLDSKFSKFGGIINNLINGATAYTGFDKVFAEFDLKNLANLKNAVLCFDDLERTHLSIGEIMGYINTFVEHENIKTIIIANEEELPTHSSGDDYYTKIKEKLIGRTIEFSPGAEYYEKVIDEFISKYSNISYRELLSENNKLILDIFYNSDKMIDSDLKEAEINSSNKNLRILKHSLDDYKKIYLHLHDYKDSDSLNKIFLKYFLAASFEFKKGNLTARELQKINYSNYQKELIFNSGEESESKTAAFFKKYNFNFGHDFLDSFEAIINYIETGYFDEELFQQEIISKISIDENKTDLQLLNQWWKLEDDTFNDVVHNVLLKAKAGEYGFFIYKKLFVNFLYFIQEEVLNMKPEDLLNDFKVGASRSASNYEFDPYKDSPVFSSELEKIKGNYKDYYEEYIKYLSEVEEKAKDDQLRGKVEELIADLIDGKGSFFDVVYSKMDQYSTTPIMKHIDVDKLEKHYDNFSNELIIKIKKLYYTDIITQILKNILGKICLI